MIINFEVIRTSNNSEWDKLYRVATVLCSDELNRQQIFARWTHSQKEAKKYQMRDFNRAYSKPMERRHLAGNRRRMRWSKVCNL